MRIGVDYGREHIDLQVEDSQQIELHRQSAAAPLTDPGAAVRDALENPHGYPALRRALTPDDHVAIVIDDGTPHLAEMLIAVLEHLAAAGIAREAVTILCPDACSPDWAEHVPEALRGVRLEVHDPADRKHLSYLATTRHDKRVYLNRTAVDADQVVVVARRRYDPLLGYAGSEGALYPALGDEETRRQMCRRLTLAAPGEQPWPTREEAIEVAWLLGTPFMVNVVEGADDQIVHIVAGVADSAVESQRLLDARWRAVADKSADTVVASVSGDPAQQNFGDLARALASAGRVVKPDGKIVLLSTGRPALGTGAEFLRQCDDPGSGLAFLRKQSPADAAEVFQWASTVQQARVYLLSGLSPETAEELFVTPLDNAEQAERLIRGDGTCLFLADAHKTMAVTAKHRNGAEPPSKKQVRKLHAE